MKKLCALLLILALTGITAGAAAEIRYEGDGYSTPEDAVLAYLDALNREDVDGMLSTFAIETLFSHLNERLYRQYVGTAFMGSLYNIPLTDEYSRSLLVTARYGTLATRLMGQYLEFCGQLNGCRIEFQNAEDIAAYEDRFTSTPLQDIAGHVEFVEWINPAQLTQGALTTPSAQASAARRKAFYGADDMTELVAHFRVNGVEGLQFMACVKYGDRWYNAEFGGDTAPLLGIDQNNQALTLAPSDSEAQLLLSRLRDNRYADAAGQWDALRLSSLAGTRWVLKKLSVPGVAVTADKAAAENAEGLSVYAELRFYSFGGALITVTGSAALREQTGMLWPDTCYGAAWLETDGKLEMLEMGPINRNAVGLDLELETVSWEKPMALFSKDTVTLRFFNGMTATFEKR